MGYHFYAMLSRMKNIYRWGLMRNTKQENLSEHSLEVAFIAHALAVIHNRRFGGNIDANKIATAAMSMSIWFNPTAMAQHHLIPSDIAGVLAEQNIEAATGSFGENSSSTFE